MRRPARHHKSDHHQAELRDFGGIGAQLELGGGGGGRFWVSETGARQTAPQPKRGERKGEGREEEKGLKLNLPLTNKTVLQVLINFLSLKLPTHFPVTT